MKVGGSNGQHCAGMEAAPGSLTLEQPPGKDRDKVEKVTKDAATEGNATVHYPWTLTVLIKYMQERHDCPGSNIIGQHQAIVLELAAGFSWQIL